jgi:hypothetical protein
VHAFLKAVIMPVAGFFAEEFGMRFAVFRSDDPVSPTPRPK